MRRSWSFVPLLAAALLAAGLAPASAVPVPAGAAPYVVVLRAGVSPVPVAREHGASWGFTPTEYFSHALRGYSARIPAAAVGALSRDPRVAYLVPDDTTYVADGKAGGQVVPTGVLRIGGDLSSARAGDGRGTTPVNVAVLDTGVDPSHPDLRVVGGAACNGKSWADEQGHGTHVAGTVAALDNGVGVVGTAPGAAVWSVRVLNAKGSGTKTTLLCGIDWVTGTRQDADPGNDIAVANLSLDGTGSDDGACGTIDKDVIHQAICASVAAGVTYVSVAGNGGHDVSEIFPGGYDEVLATTAVVDFDGRPGGAAAGTQACAESIGTTLASFPFQDDSVAFFSGYATTPADIEHTVAGPGMCITSTLPGGGYGLDSGTSMAAPHVAGVVALCIASGACAGLSPAQVIARVRADALGYLRAHPMSGYDGDPLRPAGNRYYGPLVRAALY